eukprot:maker-scaffold_75-snap-gene-0.63-mRNA-1 protein AED:0.20 eAED:0.20 QI:47/1/1/1/0.66/0.5/4/521/285
MDEQDKLEKYKADLLARESRDHSRSVESDSIFSDFFSDKADSYPRQKMNNKSISPKAKQSSQKSFEKYKINVLHPSQGTISAPVKSKSASKRNPNSLYGLQNIPKRYTKPQNTQPTNFQTQNYLGPSPDAINPLPPKTPTSIFSNLNGQEVVTISKEEFESLSKLKTKSRKNKVEKKDEYSEEQKVLLENLKEEILRLKAEKLHLQKKVVAMTSERQNNMKCIDQVTKLEDKLKKTQRLNSFLREKCKLLEEKLERAENLSEKDSKLRDLQNLNNALVQNILQIK